MAEGKRFCGGCGQAMPLAPEPVPPEPEAAKEPPSASDLANSSCVQCGTLLPPGKCFCKQCGHAVGESIPVAEPGAPTAAAEPAALICVHCGAALATGKRFCKQCGRAVDSASPTVPVKADPREQGGSPAENAIASDLPPTVPFAVPNEMPVHAQEEPAPAPSGFASEQEPDVELPEETETTTEWTTAWEPIQVESTLPPTSPGANSTLHLPESSEDWSGPENSKRIVMLAIAAVVVILAVAGSVWAWHVYSHRNVSSAANKPSNPQQSVATVPTPNQNQMATTAPQQPSKPSPGVPGNPAPSSPQSQSKSGITAPVHPESKVALPNSTQHQNIAATRPAIVPVQPSTPAAPLAAPRSGTLHYQGPPVPHFGTVVFDHLPKARLKLTFDHQVWSLTIKPNPDGTKRITLISQMPGFQTRCDLGWEVIE